MKRIRFNHVENVSGTRYRITLGGLDALRSWDAARIIETPG
jgi:hypothetical protein